MPVCTITGTLRNSQGIALTSTKVVFERSGVAGQDGAVVIPRSVEVTSDEFGAISVDLYPGVYTGITTGIRGQYKFAVGVPEELTADLADIIDQFPAITPSQVTQAIAARDQAQGFAEAAETSASRVDLGALDAAVEDTGDDRTQTGLDALATAADAAATAADRVQTGLDVVAAASARDAAFVNADVYADIATGRAAVADGGQFQVVSGDEIIRYRRDTSTTQTEVARYPGASFVDDLAGREFITFTLAGSYTVGSTSTANGGFHKEHAIDKTGLYEIGWNLGGSVRYIHAADASNNILSSWNGDVISPGAQIVVPEGATKLLLSSFGTPQNGYLTLIEARAAGAQRGVISEDEVTALAEAMLPDSGLAPALPNEVEHFDIRGNLWADGLWKNGTSTDTFARVYIIDPAETYMLHFTPSVTYEQAISTAEINGQLASGQSFSGMTHNGSLLNNLAADCDDITVNGYTATGGQWASEWTPPAGARRLIVMTQFGDPVNNVRLFKTGGRATGSLAGNPNSGKSIVVCGDSVAQNTEGEIGKSRLRGLLGCRVDTYAMGGSGWAINSWGSWITANNISGVYQIEELLKPETMAYDIYCLSATLNDPITHQKPIGTIDNCVPYLTDGLGNPDLTDPDLDTMLGGLNFAIQRIYEKNPSAKIVISTMNKAFLTSVTSGYGTAAGYDPADTTTNATGATYYQYVEAVRMLGDRWGIPIVDVYGKAGINEFNKAQMMKDQYHPTVKGSASIWSLWLDAILKA